MSHNGLTLLTVNAGSSSIRLAFFQLDETGVHAKNKIHINAPVQDPTEILVRFIEQSGLQPTLITHRVVHGGNKFSKPCVIDLAAEAQISKLSDLAPLHNPIALQWIRVCRQLLGNELEQFAIFDTAFFHNIPEVATRYAIPATLATPFPLRRYGFHGIAHRGMWRVIQGVEPLAKKVITIQLGSGCSITAISDGAVIDTSMGFSPLEGLVMATRSGDIDPGLLLYLQRTQGISVESLEEILNQDSGLKGIAGHDGDMRALLTSNEPAAKLAVDIYCYRVRKYIGAYMAALNGVDAVVFGGGVGEKSADIRARIVDNMDQLGIVIDDERNRAACGHKGCISKITSQVKLWVLPVDEAQEMAEDTAKLLSKRSAN